MFYPGQNIYTLVHSESPQALRQLPFAVPTPAPYPTNVTGIYPGGEVSAEAVTVEDVGSGVMLYKRNTDKKLSPASTTKIITALVALDHYNLDDILTVKSASSDGSLVGLFPGERMTVENLLYGLLIQSGNDAAIALAENVDSFYLYLNFPGRNFIIDHRNRTFSDDPIYFDNILGPGIRKIRPGHQLHYPRPVAEIEKYNFPMISPGVYPTVKLNFLTNFIDRFAHQSSYNFRHALILTVFLLIDKQRVHLL